MTRTFWVILTLIVVVVGGFASMLSFGEGGGGTKRGDGATASRWRRTPVVAADAPGVLTVPVAGVRRHQIADSWNHARGGGTRGHHGTDIAAPAGTPVVAAAAGRIEKLFQSDLGGTTLYVRSPAGRWTYYYAHLAGYAPGITEGRVVEAGETLGYVGDTGDAGPGNYHLHFGMTRMAPGQRWWEGANVNPYPLLAGTGARR